jgi:hypothetical protein
MRPDTAGRLQLVLDPHCSHGAVSPCSAQQCAPTHRGGYSSCSIPIVATVLSRRVPRGNAPRKAGSQRRCMAGASPASISVQQAMRLPHNSITITITITITSTSRSRSRRESTAYGAFFFQMMSSLFRRSIRASTLPSVPRRKRMRPSTPFRKKMSGDSGKSCSRFPFRS